ncbi:MAG TPA: hypothetical protein VKE93_12710 [Candidatus Angelobacter sp.]|nr:hypothetical protein [Candidatus Angelobacter sp.]
MDLRRQRIENEWTILGQMAAANPSSLLRKKRCGDQFLLALHETRAPILEDGKVKLVSDHELRISFARFFPAMPLEIYLTRPVFHPNVHPATGFVCLWSRFSQTNTVVEALCRLQRILTYSVFSGSLDDVMQPEALAWATNTERGTVFPLTCVALTKPSKWEEGTIRRNSPPRRRLF